MSKSVVNCEECGTIIPARRTKFCCNQCGKNARVRNQKAKYAEGLITGFLFNKPIHLVFYQKYKKAAENKGLAFKLSEDDFLGFWKKPCTYCGTEIETIGVDRIDSALGYSISNCTPCCTLCNLMKRHISVHNFIEHCRKIILHTKK